MSQKDTIKGITINIGNTHNLKDYNAGVKPRNDIIKTLTRLNFINLNINYEGYKISLKESLKFTRDIFKVYNFIKKHPDLPIIIQYPGYRFGIFGIKILIKVINSKNIYFLIHDINSLRYNFEISEEEINILKKAKGLLVHTDNMKQYLIKKNVVVPMFVMNLFDYYIKDKINNKNIYDNSIVFAGNLNKSEFLKKNTNLFSPYILHLYGLQPNYELNSNHIYEGKFEPDEVSEIKGNWGLVWDGDSIETCSGSIGEYLKYNIPYKLCMYISAEKPIIIWDKSGLANYVIENQIGFTVSNLHEVKTKLDQINEDEYNNIKNNIRNLKNKLINGLILENLIKENINNFSN